MRPPCAECGSTTVTERTEVTQMAVPPAWWGGLVSAYKPPVQQALIRWCPMCGHEEVRFND